MIEDNLSCFSKILLMDRGSYEQITPDMKEKYFFIINRYLSKIYPKESKLLNDKSIDKVSGMDIWFHFLKDKPYPKLMWSKSDQKKSEDIPEKDFELLFEKLNLNKREDLVFLINNHMDFLQEELKYYKKKK